MDYANLNHSELARIAQELEHEAHRGLPRELLIRIIEGASPVLPERTVNKKRLKIMQTLNENWEQVSCLISCPATSRDPRACFSCHDLQAVSCSLNVEQKISGE